MSWALPLRPLRPLREELRRSFASRKVRQGRDAPFGEAAATKEYKDLKEILSVIRACRPARHETGS